MVSSGEERSDIPDPYLPGAPNLVIEVLSPSNTVDEINDKMDVCMANGCTSFWVVDPRRKTVAVTEGDTTREYRGSATIPLPAPLEDPRPPLMTTEPTSNEQPR